MRITGATVLTYETEGHILIIRGSGSPQPSERRVFFDRMRSDAGVRDRSLLLLDARLINPPLTGPLVSERLYALLEALGAKRGKACALVVTPEQDLEAHTVQGVGTELGLHVGVFFNESEGRHWLATITDPPQRDPRR